MRLQIRGTPPICRQHRPGTHKWWRRNLSLLRPGFGLRLGTQIIGIALGTIRLQMSSDRYLNHGWRKAVRNFTPSWFTVTMGTGIVSVLLYELPYNGRWLYWLSVITFCLNICLFL